MSTAGAPTYLSTVLDGDLNSTTTMVATLLVMSIGGILSFLVSSFVVNNKKDKDKYATPWPKVEGALPFIGNLLQLKDPKYLSRCTEEWANKYSKEYGCYEMNLMGERWIVACNEARIKEIMLKRPFKVTRSAHSTETASSVGAAGVFSKEGTEWQQHRKLVAPMFNNNHIRDYIQHFRVVSKRLVDKWGSKTESFGINDDLFKYAMDLTALSSLGKDFNTLSHPNEMAANLNQTFDGIMLRALSPIHYWKIPFVGQYLDGVGFAVDRLVKSMEEIIDSYQKKKEEAGSDPDEVTLVGKVVEESEKDSELDRKTIVGNLLTVFFAGTDSIAATLCSVLQYLLEDETGLQQDLANEIRSNLPANLNDITFDDLSFENTPLLKSLILEVNRCTPAFPIVFFHTAEDVPFCGTTLPKDTEIMAMLKHVSLNPHHAPAAVPTGPNGEYKDHTQFHPRRWLVHADDKGNKDKKSGSGGKFVCKPPQVNSTSFMAFGHGRRQCLGRNSADMTIAFTIAAILQSFIVEKAPDYESAGRELFLANTPDKDIRIQLTKRE